MNNSEKMIRVVLVLAGTLSLGGTSRAWAAHSSIDVEQVALAESGSELQIRFQDRQAVPSACDYTVSRFEYVAATSLLLVELRAPNPCLTDRFGRRSGAVKWTLPSALRGSGRLDLVVNQVRVGQLELTGSDVKFTH